MLTPKWLTFRLPHTIMWMPSYFPHFVIQLCFTYYYYYFIIRLCCIYIGHIKFLALHPKCWCAIIVLMACALHSFYVEIGNFCRKASRTVVLMKIPTKMILIAFNHKLNDVSMCWCADAVTYSMHYNESKQLTATFNSLTNLPCNLQVGMSPAL